MKTQPQQQSAFFKKNKVFFVTFFSLLLYHLLFMLDRITQDVNLAAYEFHAVDYSLGFCTKLLPGAIYHLLVGRYNKTAMSIYVRIVSVLLIFLLSVLTQRLFSALSGCKKNHITLFAIVCLVCPCTFYYSLQFEGCLDAYWILLFLVCVLCAGHPRLRWGIPLLAFFMILVHEGAILCYIPLLCLLLLLKSAVAENKKERTSFLVLFVLTVIVSLGALGYFMLNNSANLKVSDIEELGAFFDSRDTTSRFYYEWYFFGSSIDGGLQEDFFPAYMFSSSTSALVQLFLKILRQIYYTLSTTNYIDPLAQILYALPLFLVLAALLIRFIRRTEKKGLRFFGVCFLLLPLLSITSGIIFSNDVLRWFSHALICLFGGSLCVCLYADTNSFHEIEALFHKHYPIILPYIIGCPVLMV